METELDLRDIAVAIWERAWIIILSALLCGGAIFVYSRFIATPIYSATTSMYVYNGGDRTNNVISQSDLATSQKLVNTYMVILKSNAVLSKVKETLSLGYSVEEIRNMISTSSINATEAFSITIKNKSPEEAKIIANTIAVVAPSEIMRVVKAGSVEVIDYAELPNVPTSPNIMKNTVIGCLLGVIVSSAAIIIYNVFDTVVSSQQKLESIFDIPVIGVIPSFNQEGDKYEYKRSKQ